MTSPKYILSIVLASILALGIGTAYAETTVAVELPIDRPFMAHECQLWNMVTLTEDGIIRYGCHWDWNLDKAVFKELERITIEKGHDYEEWLKEVIPLIENNPLKVTPKDKIGIGDTITPKVTPDEKPLTEEEKKIKEIELCFGGLEQDFAFQAEYEIERIVKEVKRDLTKLDKLAEECYAIEQVLRPTANWNYRGLVVREDTTPKSWETELKMSVGIQVTPEKMQAEAERARAYIADKSWLNQMLKPNYDNLDEVKMTQQRNEQAFQNDQAALKKSKMLERADARVIACQIMFENSAAYGNISVKWWRAWLLDGTCDDKLSADYLLYQTNGKFDNLKDLREAKQKQFQDELKQDLRLHK